MKKYNAKEFFYDTSFKDYKIIDFERRKRIFCIILFLSLFFFQLFVTHWIFDFTSFYPFNLGIKYFIKLVCCKFFIILSLHVCYYISYYVIFRRLPPQKTTAAGGLR